jgi:hypothetical protein
VTSTKLDYILVWLGSDTGTRLVLGMWGWNDRTWGYFPILPTFPRSIRGP